MGQSATDFVQEMTRVCQAAAPKACEIRHYRRVVLAGVGIAVFVAVLGIIKMVPNAVKTKPVRMVPEYVHLLQVTSSSQLIDQLKDLDLWNRPLPSNIPPVVVDGYPDDIERLDVDDKKRAFLHTLLPMALIARAEVAEERQDLEGILTKIGDLPEDLVVNYEEPPVWQTLLAPDEVKFLDRLARKYRTTQTAKLLRRVDTIPVSLIMAQGAIESSWGSSRFASQGNNLFGIWTWGANGIVPARREEGKNHKVAAYGTLLDSVRSYVLMLNRLQAYRHFRELRQDTNDPIILAQGLINYSEKRGAYVEDLARIIEHNRLRDYDHLKLAVDLGSTEAHPKTVALNIAGQGS